MKLLQNFKIKYFGIFLLFGGALLQAQTVYTTPYSISTYSGVIAGRGSGDGTGANASFNSPEGVAFDSAGNTYVADAGNNTIRMIDTNGVVSTIAGAAGLFGNTDGYGTNARFNAPWGIAVDSRTNLYIADSGNNTIRQLYSYSYPSTLRLLSQTDKVTITNSVTVTNWINVHITITTTGTNATTNAVTNPTLYYTNTASVSNVVTKSSLGYTNWGIATNWAVFTLAGSARGSLDGSNAAARFNTPTGIALDDIGDLYIADTGNNTIRKMTQTLSTLVVTNSGVKNTNYFISWVVTTLAGSAGTNGSADGIGTNALFNQPAGLALDASTNIYIADSGNNTIRKISAGAVVTTLAGSAGASGNVNGTGTNALFRQPLGLALNGTNLLVADSANYSIRSVTTNGDVTTFAGSGVNGNSDGTGTNASFDYLSGIAVNTNNGEVVVADNGNNRIRQLTSNAVVTGLAGMGITQPFGVAVDTKTNLYIADSGNNLIRKIDTNGVLTILAGMPGVTGTNNGTGTNALFNQPMGIAVDAATNLYIADSANDTVRKIVQIQGTTNGPANVVKVLTVTNVITSILITNTVTNITQVAIVTGQSTNTNTFTTYAYTSNTPTTLTNTQISTNLVSTNTVAVTNWVVTTPVGLAGNPGSADGTNAAARFNFPDGVALDAATNLYIADTGNDTVRKITRSGTNWVVATIAGSAGTPGSSDGTNSAALFNAPEGVAVDAANNLFVTDSANNTVRKIARSGTNWVVATIAGKAGIAGSADGLRTNALFHTPFGVAVDTIDNLYIADSGNQTLRKIAYSGVVTTLAGTPGSAGNANGTGSNASFYQPTGVALDKATNLYVADVNNNAIRKGNPATKPTKTQIIRFSAIPRQTFTGSNAVVLNASASSGLPVNFTSADTSIATVSGTNLMIVGAGSVLITASQEGNGLYKAAPSVSQLLIVSKGVAQITLGSIPSFVYGSTNSVTLVATNTANLPVVFSSGNTNALIVSTNTTTISTNGLTISSNVASVVGAGIVTVTAGQAANNSYSAATASRILTITKAPQTISFISPTNGTVLSLTNGASFPLVATADSSLPVTNFVSGNTGVLTISGTTATKIGAGTVTITAQQSGNANYSAATPVTNTVILQ